MSGRALVVGASGQVGNAIASLLGPSALLAGRSPVPPAYVSGEWAHIDLVELAHEPAKAAQVLDGRGIGCVYCVGGATDVERCESDPEWAMDTNYRGPLALAKASTAIPFVYFSTEYVFDGVDGPYDEDSPTHAISEYGRSKLLGEQEILAAHPSPLIIRTTVVYGRDPARKNFLYTLRRLLGSGKTMRVPVDQISTPTYNPDLAAATIALATSGPTGIFHVCGPELLSRYDFALLAAKEMDLDAALLQPVTTAELNQRAPRPLSAGMNIGKLQRTLPQIPMRTNSAAIRDWIAREQA